MIFTVVDTITAILAMMLTIAIGIYILCTRAAIVAKEFCGCLFSLAETFGIDGVLGAAFSASGYGFAPSVGPLPLPCMDMQQREHCYGKSHSHSHKGLKLLHSL